MRYFVVIRVPGPAWNAARSMREQTNWDEHAAFMNALADEGFVVLGGPVGDVNRFLLVVDAETEEAIHTRFADDPWTPTGMLRVASVEPWEILLGR